MFWNKCTRHAGSGHASARPCFDSTTRGLLESNFWVVTACGPCYFSIGLCRLHWLFLWNILNLNSVFLNNVFSLGAPDCTWRNQALGPAIAQLMPPRFTQVEIWSSNVAESSLVPWPVPENSVSRRRKWRGLGRLPARTYSAILKSTPPPSLLVYLPVSSVSTFIGTRHQRRDTIAGSSCPRWPKSWSRTPALRVSLWFYMSVRSAMLTKRRPASASPRCTWHLWIISAKSIFTVLLALRRWLDFGLEIFIMSSLGLAGE